MKRRVSIGSGLPCGKVGVARGCASGPAGCRQMAPLFSAPHRRQDAKDVLPFRHGQLTRRICRTGRELGARHRPRQPRRTSLRRSRPMTFEPLPRQVKCFTGLVGRPRSRRACSRKERRRAGAESIGHPYAEVDSRVRVDDATRDESRGNAATKLPPVERGVLRERPHVRRDHRHREL